MDSKGGKDSGKQREAGAVAATKPDVVADTKPQGTDKTEEAGNKETWAAKRREGWSFRFEAWITITSILTFVLLCSQTWYMYQGNALTKAANQATVEALRLSYMQYRDATEPRVSAVSAEDGENGGAFVTLENVGGGEARGWFVGLAMEISDNSFDPRLWKGTPWPYEAMNIPAHNSVRLHAPRHGMGLHKDAVVTPGEIRYAFGYMHPLETGTARDFPIAANEPPRTLTRRPHVDICFSSDGEGHPWYPCHSNNSWVYDKNWLDREKEPGKPDTVPTDTTLEIPSTPKGN